MRVIGADNQRECYLAKPFNTKKMTAFSRVLAALDLSLLDKKLLEYLASVSPVFETQKVYFVHIMPDFKVPKNVDVEFHKLFSSAYPVDEKVRDELAFQVGSAFEQLKGIELNVEVREGSPYKKLIHWTEVKEVDLLVVGQKEISEGSGITAKRVARKTKCNVLFVPNKASADIKNILVPIDFSDHSAKALRSALEICKKLPDAKVTCLYVVDLPIDDYYSRSLQSTGYKAVLMEAAQKAYDQFMQEHAFDLNLIEPTFVENYYQNTAQHIHEYAQNAPCDLIMIGAQGHTAFENFLYGSVTERLVEKNKSVPLMIIR